MRPLFEGAALYLGRQMDAGVFRRHDARELIVTGYGALLTSFSDAPILDGLLGPDPFDQAAIASRVDHVLGFFGAALVV